MWGISMIELSTALRGTDSLTQSANNIGAGSGVDNRRYTKFDRTASEVATAENFSFSDLLDTINPLQHIPLVSSIYRGITGDEIHPAARVAGDILYGGAIGLASAALGGLGGLADSVMIDKSGTSMGGAMLAGVFNDEPQSQTSQPEAAVAQNVAPTTTLTTTAPASTIATITPPTNTAVNQPANTPAERTEASIALPKEITPEQLDGLLTKLAQSTQKTTTTPDTAPAINASTNTTTSTTDSTAPAFSLTKAKAFPVPERKQAFGGVMDISTYRHTGTSNTLNMPLKPIGSRNGTASLESINSAIATTTTDTPNPLPQGLIEELRAMAATQQYQATARNTLPGVAKPQNAIDLTQ